MMNAAMKCDEGRLPRWFPSAVDYPENRLFSLDALRGLDMLLLTVLLFGQLALTAYFVSHFFGPALTAAAHSCSDGLVSWLPKSAAPFVLRLFFTAELVAVMVIWRRAKRA